MWGDKENVDLLEAFQSFSAGGPRITAASALPIYKKLGHFTTLSEVENHIAGSLAKIGEFVGVYEITFEQFAALMERHAGSVDYCAVFNQFSVGGYFTEQSALRLAALLIGPMTQEEEEEFLRAIPQKSDGSGRGFTLPEFVSFMKSQRL
jgi:hypothetical protein